MIGVDLIGERGRLNARIDKGSLENDLVLHKVGRSNLTLDLREVGDCVGGPEATLDRRELEASRRRRRGGGCAFGDRAAHDPNIHSAHIFTNVLFHSPDEPQEGEPGQRSESDRGDQHDDLLISHNYLTCLGRVSAANRPVGPDVCVVVCRSASSKFERNLAK